jgi:pilus assembly protein CpaC
MSPWKAACDWLAVSMQERSSSGTDRGFDFGVFDPTDAFVSFLDVLQKQNVARILANPSLVIVSGRPASFEVGGQLPLPESTGSGKAVEFQSFSTKFHVMAVALGDQNIRMEVHVQLAEPDFARSIQIAGAQVPAMNRRELDSAIELKSGQSGLLKGLVQPRESAIASESGVETKTEEIETWFIVTPELVSSIASAPTAVR